MTASNLAVNLYPSAFGPGSKPAWTEMDVDLLKRFYGSIPAGKLAKKLKRSARSVTCKAFRLGLKKSHERLREMGRENVENRWK